MVLAKGVCMLDIEQFEQGFAATDEHFAIAAWNRAAEELYGWPAAEVIGRPVG
jgi:PAS domain S-box-containing protein